LEEKGHIYFKEFRPTPYMILSFWATEEGKRQIPAVVHVDGSCRVQSVTKDANPLYHALISEFERLTGVGAVMNTSFNLKGDAIVESPKDAIETFYTSGLDFLVIGSYLVGKDQDLRAIVERVRQQSAAGMLLGSANGDAPKSSRNAAVVGQ
jgi:carbamoyltransferase